MSMRIILIAAACIFWSATAQAAPASGGLPGGTNFFFDELYFTCDGTLKDCSAMAHLCQVMQCPGSTCTCRRKLPAAAGQAKPKPGAPVRVSPTSPTQRQSQ